MKLELKNIQHAAFASEETNCYEATLYVDGKRFATVGNEGRGGADRVHPVEGATNATAFHAKLAEINAWLAANHPGIDMSEYGKEPIPCDLELWCGEQVNIFLASKELKRRIKRKVMLVEDGKVYEVKLDPSAANLARVQAKYPTAKILNALPFDAALALYRQHG